MLKPATIVVLISASLLAVLHYIALTLFLYWQIWWFDIPMHLFGGATIVIGLYAAVELRILPSGTLKSLIRILLIVLAIAISWEIFQFMITEIMKPNYVSDTIGDIVVGLIGGLVGYTIAKRLQDLD